MRSRRVITSLRGRLLLLVLIALLPIVAIILYAGSLQRREALDVARLQAIVTARQAAAIHRAVFEQAQMFLKVMGRRAQRSPHIF